MKDEAPRSRRSAITEYRNEVTNSPRGVSWLMLLDPSVLMALGPLVVGGIWLLAEGDFLWGSLALAAAIAPPLYFVLLTRGESRLLRRLGERREERLARASRRVSGAPSNRRSRAENQDS